MADNNDNNPKKSDDENATLKQASDDARAKAIEKMRQTQERVAKEAAEAAKKAEDQEKAKEVAHTSTMDDFVGTSTEDGKIVLEKKEAKIDEATGQPILSQVKVYSPFKVYFDNDAFSISATNGTGPFDILPGHKNFLSLLLPGELVIRASSGDEKLKIERGIMHVSGDVVRVFLDV